MTRISAKPLEIEDEEPGVPPPTLTEVEDNFDSIPDWKIASVYRAWPLDRERPSAKPAYCGQISQGQGSDEIARNWGGGVFLIYFKTAKGTAGSRRITIDGPPLAPRREPPPPNPNPYSSQQVAQPLGLPPAAQPPMGLFAQQDPTLLLLTKLVDRLDVLERRLADPPMSQVSKVQEFAEMAKAMREITGAQKFEPQELVSWMRQGLELGREISQGGDDEARQPEAIEVIAGAITRYLDFREKAEAERRGVLAGRRLPEQMAAPAARPTPVAPPPQAAKPEKPSPPRPKEPIQAVQEEGPGLPQWVAKAAQEFIRALRTDDDPAYTAAFLERNIPTQHLERLRASSLYAVKSELMQLAPLVQKYTPMRDEFVDAVAQALLLIDVAAPAPDPGGGATGTAPPAASHAPDALELEDEDDDEEDEEEDDDDDEDDELEDGEDDENDNDDDEEEDEEEDDEPDDKQKTPIAAQAGA